MQRYFKLAAIVVQSEHISLFRIPLRAAPQQNLANNWNNQCKKFIDNTEELDFTIGYRLEGKQLFRVCSPELSDWLGNQNVNKIPELNSDNEKELLNFIQGIVAFVRDDNNDDILLFQNFTPSQIIHSHRFLFRDNDAYDEFKKPAISLATKLSAVYLPKDDKLLFRSFRNVNTFLPLSVFYYEASEEDILNVLNNKLFACQDKFALVNNSTQWIRKRFAMLIETNILDKLSVTQIETRSKKYNVEFQVVNDKIVFPTDNAEVKKLLQLLNEEIFQGALTDDIYETNSKKKTDL